MVSSALVRCWVSLKPKVAGTSSQLLQFWGDAPATQRTKSQTDPQRLVRLDFYDLREWGNAPRSVKRSRCAHLLRVFLRICRELDTGASIPTRARSSIAAAQARGDCAFFT